MHTAGRAKPMLDDVLVERVRRGIGFRRQQVELVPWNEPQQGTLAGTDRAIACHRSVEITFNFECDLLAVTASSVGHASLLMSFKPTCACSIAEERCLN